MSDTVVVAAGDASSCTSHRSRCVGQAREQLRGRSA